MPSSCPSCGASLLLAAPHLKIHPTTGKEPLVFDQAGCAVGFLRKGEVSGVCALEVGGRIERAVAGGGWIGTTPRSLGFGPVEFDDPEALAAFLESPENGDYHLRVIEEARALWSGALTEAS